MRILFITQWYRPINAPVKRMVTIAESLAKWTNFQVTVLTGMPSYPDGILPQKYKNKLYLRENIGKINVVRTYEFPTANRGIFRRLFNNISFTLSSSLAILFMPFFDIVIVSSPSFLSGITGLLAKKIYRSKFIFDIRDLWPDSAIELGFIKKKWLINLLCFIEKKYYQNADIILAATPSIKYTLKEKNIDPKKTIVLLNSVDTNQYKPKKVSRNKYGFSNSDFIFAYTGNHSSVQDLSTTLKAAKILNKFPKIKFLFVGEGESKNKLIQNAKEMGLTNVVFWSLKKMEEIIDIINLADAGNISLAKIKIFQNAIPTKASEYLACGKPIIASVGGDLKKYLINYNAGLVVSSGNKDSLAKSILKLYQNPALKKIMGKNARKLALDKFSQLNFNESLQNIFTHLSPD